MISYELEMRLGTIAEVVYRMLKHFNMHTCCVDASALLVAVYRKMGFPDTYPLTVGVMISNPAYCEWVAKHGKPEGEAAGQRCEDAGGKQIRVGWHENGKTDENNWNGHLAAIVPNVSPGSHLLVDLTIEQGSRAEHNVELRQTRFLVDDRFVSGKHFGYTRVNGCVLMYEAYPNDHSYGEKGDITDGQEKSVAMVLEVLSANGITP